MDTKHRDFLKLQKIWYAKLKAEGFNDLECRGHNGLLRQDDIFEHFPRQFMLRPESDTLRWQFLDADPWRDKREKKMWTRYCESAGRSFLVENNGLTKHQTYTRFKKVKARFDKWFKHECSSADLDDSYDPAQLVREMDEEYASRAAESGRAMTPKGEVWKAGKGWVRSHTTED